MDNITTDDGETLHLRISGAGRPLLLLHGWTSSHRDWNPFIEPLAQHFQVFRWDARGHGGHTLQRDTPVTVQRMARDLHLVLEHHEVQDAVVVGHSMGALTLWQYVQDFGCERLGGAVILDQSPRLLTDTQWQMGIYGNFNHTRNQAFITELQTDLPEAVLRLVAFGLNPKARLAYDINGENIQLMRKRLAQLDPIPLIRCWQSLTAADYRPVLTKMFIPTLLIYGDQSNFYTTKTAHFVADTLPRARLLTYSNADHAPHLCHRERFFRDMMAFLS